MGLRKWNDLEIEEKKKIWQYLNHHFFVAYTTEFVGEGGLKGFREASVFQSILILNEKYKVQSFAKNFLEDSKFASACGDFYTIFMEQEEDVVMEIISLYAKMLYGNSKNDHYTSRLEKETDDVYSKRMLDASYKHFDDFSDRLNDVFLQFGLNYYLTRAGFTPRQDEKIMDEIYNPVIKALSDEKFEKVNEILADAFDDYRKNTPPGYSACITNAIAALQAFLQILVEDKIGSSTGINALVKIGIENDVIPSDEFSKKVFKDIDSILMRERGKTGNAHPKKEYSNEKSARMVLNLVMIFIQHCIQK